MTQILTITATQAKELLDKDQAILIDVREPAEHRAENIECAKNLPLSTLQADQIKPYLDQGKKILLHCKSGKRSQSACEKIVSSIDTDIYTIEGGIDSLSACGLCTQKSKAKTLPLDRQVQLTISLMILLGLLIYKLISPIGLLLPLAAGLGLMNAALTGWCGMALLLAKMPWNK